MTDVRGARDGPPYHGDGVAAHAGHHARTRRPVATNIIAARLSTRIRSPVGVGRTVTGRCVFVCVTLTMRSGAVTRCGMRMSTWHPAVGTHHSGQASREVVVRAQRSRCARFLGPHLTARRVFRGALGPPRGVLGEPDAGYRGDVRPMSAHGHLDPVVSYRR